MKTIPCNTFEEAKQIVEDYDLHFDTLDMGGYPVDYVWWKSYPYVQPKYKVAHFNAKQQKLYIYE